MSLADKICEPCRGGTPPLPSTEQVQLLRELKGWEMIDSHHLSRTITFPDFAKALELVVKIGELAEEVGHHPDILLSWGRVKIDIWTHKIDNLTEADFVLAAKIDKIAPALS